MAFLDNSGDIILDAVLTDHGRKVLSKGDLSESQNLPLVTKKSIMNYITQMPHLHFKT